MNFGFLRLTLRAGMVIVLSLSLHLSTVQAGQKDCPSGTVMTGTDREGRPVCSPAEKEIEVKTTVLSESQFSYCPEGYVLKNAYISIVCRPEADTCDAQCPEAAGNKVTPATGLGKQDGAYCTLGCSYPGADVYCVAVCARADK